MDPIRLLDGELTMTERELLESARAETPDAKAQAVLLAGIGLPLASAVFPTAGSTLNVSSASTQLGATGSTLSTPPSAIMGTASAWGTGLAAQAGAKSGLSAVIAWATGLGLVGALGLGFWVLNSNAPTEQCEGGNCETAAAPANAFVEPAAHTEESSPNAQHELSAAARSDEPGLATPPSVVEPTPAISSHPRTVASPASLPRATTSPSLTAEVRALEPARSLLAQNRAEAALQVLSAYRSAFPRGLLKPEAEALRRRAQEILHDGRADKTRPR